jgi:hypothetical protein
VPNGAEVINTRKTKHIFMQNLKRPILLALLLMGLVFIAFLLMPDPSSLGLRLGPTAPKADSLEGCLKLGIPGQYECLLKLASNRKNETICIMIESEFHKDQCYKSLSSDCSALSLPDSRGECFAKEALASGGPETCEKALGGSNGQEARDNCLFSYSIGSGDRKSCTLIAAAERAGPCVYYFASSAGRAEACSSENEGATAYCVLRFALDAQNSGYCSLLQEPARDTCILQVSRTYNDRSACSLISDFKLRESCMNG